MIQSFQLNFDQFKEILSGGKSYSEVRKYYLKLLKIYHPDKAEESQKKIFEDYTVKIVNLYEEYINQKITAAENDFSNQMKPENQGQVLTYIKLMEIARNEYIAYKKIGYGFVSDPEELKRRYENYLKHLGTAVKCYKTVINECHDPELVLAARKQLEWVQRLYNSYL